MADSKKKFIVAKWMTPGMVFDTLHSPSGLVMSRKDFVASKQYQPTGSTAEGVLSRLENVILAYADRPTLNSMVFSRKLWENLLNNKDEMHKMRDLKCAFGEADHADRESVHLPDVSHRVVDFRIDKDNFVRGSVDILDTPHGNIIHNLLKSSYVGISSRGWGDLVPLSVTSGYDLTGYDPALVSDVDPDSYLHTSWDYVSVPAVPEAVMTTIASELHKQKIGEKVIASLKADQTGLFLPLVAKLEGLYVASKTTSVAKTGVKSAEKSEADATPAVGATADDEKKNKEAVEKAASEVPASKPILKDDDGMELEVSQDEGTEKGDKGSLGNKEVPATPKEPSIDNVQNQGEGKEKSPGIEGIEDGEGKKRVESRLSALRILEDMGEKLEDQYWSVVEDFEGGLLSKEETVKKLIELGIAEDQIDVLSGTWLDSNDSELIEIRKNNAMGLTSSRVFLRSSELERKYPGRFVRDIKHELISDELTADEAYSELIGFDLPPKDARGLVREWGEKKKKASETESVLAASGVKVKIKSEEMLEGGEPQSEEGQEIVETAPTAGEGGNEQGDFRQQFTDAVVTMLEGEGLVAEGNVVIDSASFLLEDGYLIQKDVAEGESMLPNGSLAVDLFNESGSDVSKAVEYVKAIPAGGLGKDEEVEVVEESTEEGAESGGEEGSAEVEPEGEEGEEAIEVTTARHSVRPKTLTVAEKLQNRKTVVSLRNRIVKQLKSGSSFQQIELELKKVPQALMKDALQSFKNEIGYVKEDKVLSGSLQKIVNLLQIKSETEAEGSFILLNDPKAKDSKGKPIDRNTMYKDNGGKWERMGKKAKSSASIQSAGVPYDVYLNGDCIDTVYFDEANAEEELKKSLVEHDGYDPAIEVRSSKAIQQKQYPNAWKSHAMGNGTYDEMKKRHPKWTADMIWDYLFADRDLEEHKNADSDPEWNG